MRVFLDANVLFTAAHNPLGKAALLFEFEASGAWKLCSSHYALEEARRNLERKFPKALGRLDALQTQIRLVDHRADLPVLVGLAQKDQPVFQGAIACRATHLLTGDLKDFGPFMNRKEKTRSILIQTVAEFLMQRSGVSKRQHPLG